MAEQDAALAHVEFSVGHWLARPYREGDVAALHAAVQESVTSVSRWMDWCHKDYDEAVAAKWIAHCHAAWLRGDEYAFAIFDTRNGEFAGAVGINHRARLHNFAGIGYWIRDSQRGHGLASLIGRRVAQFGFDEVKLARIEIVAAMENHASRRTAERIGARFEGVQRNRLRVGDRHLDAAMYALVPADFSAN